MSEKTITQATESLYTALNGEEQQDIDNALAVLRKNMMSEKQKSVEIEPTKLPNNTRQGRRMLLSYAKKRGVKVTFPKNS